MTALTFTISAGWWLLPLAVTIAAFGCAAVVARPSSSPGYGDGIIAFMAYELALIVSLVAWVIWAVLS